MKNLSELITSIKMDLGLYGLSLPIEDLDKTLYEVIKLKTIKTFSAYMPNKHRIELDIANLDFIKQNYTETIIRLPNIFGDRRIISIGTVNYGDYNRSTGYSSVPEMYGTMDLYNSVQLSAATAHVNSLITPSFTFKYESPNILHLYNFSTISTKLIVEVYLEHFDNLMSIPNGAFLSFEKLALLDIQAFIYNIVKHYDQIQTAHGSVTLKIDDWEQAREKREDLLKEWDRTAHLHGEQFIIA